jgi:hypothetical protein
MTTYILSHVDVKHLFFFLFTSFYAAGSASLILSSCFSERNANGRWEMGTKW